MGYLQPAEYVGFGLSADTADAWIASASAMMEAHCRRPTLLAASYTEKLRVGPRTQTVRLSYGPLQAVTAVSGKYGRLDPNGYQNEFEMLARVFALPGEWVSVDPTTLDVNTVTGEVGMRLGLFSLPFAEVKVTYTAGLVVVPDAVKIACAQVVKNAQATPGLNVKTSRLDRLQTEYFSGVLLDPQVQALLRPYVAERLS